MTVFTMTVENTMVMGYPVQDPNNDPLIARFIEAKRKSYKFLNNITVKKAIQTVNVFMNTYGFALIAFVGYIHLRFTLVEPRNIFVGIFAIPTIIDQFTVPGSEDPDWLKAARNIKHMKNNVDLGYVAATIIIGSYAIKGILS